MGVSLEKVEQQAPHLVSLVKQTQDKLSKQGFNPDRYKAGVVATLDFSGSTEMGGNRLYSGKDRIMQSTADMAFAGGLVFDDDGEVPVSLFHNSVIPVGNVNLGNCQGFVDQVIRGRDKGGTSYVAALQWIVEEAGFGGVDLSGPPSVRRTAQYPTFAIFVTDGEPNPGTEPQVELMLQRMSQLPIFVQFIGVGEHNFSFLRKLDKLEGRLIDNAGFFDAKDAGHDQSKMLDLMLSEFPSYYLTAKRSGLLAG